MRDNQRMPQDLQDSLSTRRSGFNAIIRCRVDAHLLRYGQVVGMGHEDADREHDQDGQQGERSQVGQLPALRNSYVNIKHSQSLITIPHSVAQDVHIILLVFRTHSLTGSSKILVHTELYILTFNETARSRKDKGHK